MSFVLDASVILAWAIEDESTRYADAAQDAIAAGAAALAPCHWVLEVANALLVAERRQRIDRATVDEFLDRLEDVPIQTEEVSLDTVRASLLGTARTYKLTAYDVAYLDLADKRGMPLATLDLALVAAARKSRIKLWAPPR